MMDKAFKILLTFSMMNLMACSQNGNGISYSQLLKDDFSNEELAWEPVFADYNFFQEDEMNFRFEHSTLPEPLDTSKKSILLSGKNKSDDLFMGAKMKISGLEKNRTYDIRYEISIASNEPEGRVGVGGAPGESVFIKAGASAIEPLSISSGEGINNDFMILNIDKGIQSVEGENMEVLGDFTNGTRNIMDYRLINRRSTRGTKVTSNDQGEIWLIFGTESGFEATTTIYYNEIKVYSRAL